MHTFFILIPLFNLKQNRKRGEKITDYNVTWPNQHIPPPFFLLLYPELKTKNKILEENWRLTSKEWMQRSLKRTDFATTDLLKTVNDSQSNGNLPFFFFKFTFCKSKHPKLTRSILGEIFFLFFYSQWTPGWQKKTVDFHSILSPTASWSVGLPFLKWVGANGQKPPLYLFYELTTFSDHHEPCSLFCKEKGRVMLTLFLALVNYAIHP